MDENKEITTCETCVKTPETIPYIAHEAAMERASRQNKNLIIALIIAISLIFISNAAWLYAWCQYDYSSYEFNSGEGGYNSFIGNDGDINYGTDESKNP